ncbi:MAG: DUF423 domain-containing protein [Deltaproteobacteria bacterium]|nr:DUF423 domain-containing protein [Deltaproteobacteria bacterium]
MYKLWLLSSALFGLLTVALGAFGAHALKDVLEAYGKSIYEKAVHYQMFHALALMGVGLLQKNFEEINFSPAGWAFLAGVILFSGSLYLLAVTQIRWLGAITPIGGTAFIIGWAWLIYLLSKI